MPDFHVKHNGQDYLVKADSMEQAAAAFDPPPGPGMGGSAPPNTFVDPKTGQPTNPAPLQPYSDIARQGIAEPVMRGAEGIGDAVGQFARKDQQDQYKQMVDARRAQFMKDNPGNSEGLEDLGGAAASSLLPIGALGKTESLLGGIVRGATAGGVASDLQYTPKGQSKGMQVATGAGAGGIFAALAGVLPAAKNVVTRAITAAEDNPRVKEVIDAAKGFFGGSQAVPKPTGYSIAQSTASPTMERLQGRAFGPAQQELGAQQGDQARARFEELANTAAAASGIPATSEGVAAAVNKTLDTTLTGMRKAKGDAFKAGMTDVLALDTAAPTKVRVGLDNVREAYENILKQDSNAFNLHGTTLPQSVKDTLDVIGPGGAVKVKAVNIPTLQYIMQGLGQGMDHGAGMVLSDADRRLNMYRQQLFAALNKDIDAAGVTAGSNPAFAKLQQVRQGYAQQSDAIRRVENDSIVKLFGSPEALATPATALDKFYSLKPDDQKFAINLLGQKSPETLEAMRGHQIRTALEDATQAGNAKNSTFDISRFNETMFGQGRDKSPLWTSGGVTGPQVRAGAAHLKVLMNAAHGGPGSVIGPEDIAINVISRNPAFLARVLTRAVYGTGGDKLLGTPEGLAALRTLSNTSSKTSQAYAAALSYVTNLGLQGGDAPAQ